MSIIYTYSGGDVAGSSGSVGVVDSWQCGRVVGSSGVVGVVGSSGSVGVVDSWQGVWVWWAPQAVCVCVWWAPLAVWVQVLGFLTICWCTVPACVSGI